MYFSCTIDLDYVTVETKSIVTKSPLFWDIRPCSPLKDNRRFGTTYRLHLQGRRISQARNHHEALATCFMLVYCLAYSYYILYLIVSQEIGLFITTAVRTS
jgi:hypothetical protein